ncbi:cupin domain-containing protein [Paraferrimonas sedimenticola]|uniref:Cupin type-2 domain-containing protein n=1 Tax=Paraferrimonas sedimenticola TaxID=375674 RepID=A0AA37VT68_9GAMM|nr:cupin domain-containing protein [Paraferrimonas sedimenticola]GLP95111.1 hypothetical protein GCM10007895_04170 [Paraferrimonas sedimenticola]
MANDSAAIGNLFQAIAAKSNDEQVDILLEKAGMRLERIVSHGHASAPDFWYDQSEHEWVTVLSGWGELTFDDGEVVRLTPGEHINIPAHKRHRVSATSATEATVWLALFY